LGYNEDAEKLYRRALALRERALGPNHPSVADVLEAWAELELSRGQIKPAEQFYLRVLAIREARLNRTHPVLTRTLQ
jgi:hypothetical protein